jgi:hypothetical protein
LPNTSGLWNTGNTKNTAFGFTCDRSGTTFPKNGNTFEYQEGHRIAFTGGQGSLFGNGAR